MAMRWCRLYKGTPAEIELEEAVAALGVPYRTQFPYWLYGLRFFPDFLLPTLGVIIEVDDPSHNEPAKMEADRIRTEALAAEGWRVVRCTNEQALSDPHGTVRALMREAGCPVPRRRLRECLPRPRKAPQKERREAITQARRLSRQRADGDAPKPPRRRSPPPSLSSD